MSCSADCGQVTGAMDTEESGGAPAGCACPASDGAPCGSRPCAAERAALVSEYLRQALPPVLVLPSCAPSGQLVLGCDARLPAVPYGEPLCTVPSAGWGAGAGLCA